MKLSKLDIMHPFLSQLRDAFANDYDEPSATGLGHGMRDAEVPLEGRAGKFILLMDNRLFSNFWF